MKITFEPQAEYVSVTIENDDDAKRFCEIAAQVVMDCETYADVPQNMKKIYEEYGQQQAAQDTLYWDRRLWDYVVREIKLGSVTVRFTFGQALMQRLNLT